MTIPFACSCGKSFQAKDEFAGKRTKCPACGQILVIPPPPQAEAPADPPAAWIHFRCECGKEFKVKPEFAGRSTKCPACGRTLVVPGGQAPPPPTLPPETPQVETAAGAVTDSWKDEIAAEEGLEDQPPLKKRPARRRSRALLIAVGVIVVLIAGAGGGAAYYWLLRPFWEAGKPIARKPADGHRLAAANDANDGAEKVNLGEDLNLVPKDAVGFAAVRLADWAASPLVQQLRKQPLALLLPDPDKEMERAVGLKPADIERVTLVLPVMNVMVNWTMVFTRKPYDQEKILQLLGSTQEKQLRGKKYHYSEAQKLAVHFVNDHLLIAGTDEGVRLFLAPSEPNSKAMIAPLKLAATGRHHVTAALNLPPIILGALMPPELKPFEAVVNTTGMTLTLDAADGLELDAKINYPDEAGATKAEQAANGLLQWGRSRLTELKEGLSQGPDGPALQPTFKLVDSLVQNIPISRQGKTVEVRWQVDSKTVTSAPALLLPAVQRVRMAANRLKTSNNLKQLALAMYQYQDKHGHLPPAVITSPDGRPLYSWRVELLPFLEQDALYQEFKKDEPWDGPHNRKLLAKMPPVFALEGVPAKEPGTTFFQLFVGPGTPFGDKKPPRLPASFPAGTSNTVLIVTAAEAVPWTKPADLVYDPKGPLPKLGRQLSAGTPVVYADGSARFLGPTMSEKEIRAQIAPTAPPK